MMETILSSVPKDVRPKELISLRSHNHCRDAKNHTELVIASCLQGRKLSDDATLYQVISAVPMVLPVP